MEERLVEHVAEIMRDGHGRGRVARARRARTSCPRAPQCPKCGGTGFRKETDILDVWFDSGCSHAAVLEQRPELRWPAEMYLEGSDQHRGWFHSSLLEAVGTRGAPPYRSVLTHGFVVDGDGRKMSKSRGNYITPEELIPKYGAEVLRLWVAAEDYTRGHPALRRDPEPRSPTRTGASATRAASSWARSPTSIPSAIACPTISSRSSTAGRCCAWAS